jgi:hypothetical protein
VVERRGQSQEIESGRAAVATAMIPDLRPPATVPHPPRASPGNFRGRAPKTETTGKFGGPPC